MKPSIFDSQKLSHWVSQNGLPAYRLGQIKQWLFESRCQSFDQMTNLPANVRSELGEQFDFWSTSIAKHQSSDDGTEKLLVSLSGGGAVECVLLRDGIRRTICVSSQVGCAMGCVFCASGLDGVDRNLHSHEIVDQMVRLQRLLPVDERLSHIVMMGMGEPLANIDNVLSALDIASSPDGLGISPRRITISTVGIPAAIKKLASSGSPYNLAISLHAPDDELRNKLVPVNRKIGIESILAAADGYFETTGRRLTFEYVLLAGINDQVDQAEKLIRLLKQRNALLNVIPYNRVEGLPYKTPSAASIQSFRDVLLQGGINVKFRQRKGDEISAACGQLRRTVPITSVQ